MKSSKALDTSIEADQGVLDQALLNGRPAFLGFLMKRLGNHVDAEDVLQEFCIRVLARKDQLRDADRVEAWLYAILRSTLNDFYRKSGRRDRLGAAFAQEPKTDKVSADASEAFAQICACVRGLITQLRPIDGNILNRIDIEGENRKAVAADLKLTAGALAVRLFRARAALRDMLLEHCGCCCEHGFEDCSCPPAGCADPVEDLHCAPRENPL